LFIKKKKLKEKDYISKFEINKIIEIIIKNINNSDFHKEKIKKISY